MSNFYDSQVAASAGRAAARIDAFQLEVSSDAFQLEVSSDACALPYDGAETCTTSVVRLRAMGIDTPAQCARPRTWASSTEHSSNCATGDVPFYRKHL